VLNSREPTLTRVDVKPISSYNIFLDGVLVVDGSCTHEPNHKDRNPWESMKPVTIHPTGPNCFCSGVGTFLNFGVPNVFHMVIINPFHQVWNCYLLCSQLIPQVPNVFPITLHFLSFLSFKKKFNGTNGKIHCQQNQYKMKGKAEGNTQPAQPRNTVEYTTKLLTDNLCPRFYCNLFT
jgi:hypothetical protein